MTIGAPMPGFPPQEISPNTFQELLDRLNGMAEANKGHVARIEGAMRLLAGQDPLPSTLSAEVVVGWLKSLDWEAIESRSLSGDLSTPIRVLWMTAMLEAAEEI